MPGYQDGNSAAERAILKSMLQSIDSIQHATEVAISTFTDAIIINRLQQNQVVLTCVDTHPWTFLRDIALSFAVDAKRQRIGNYHRRH